MIIKDIAKQGIPEIGNILPIKKINIIPIKINKSIEIVVVPNFGEVNISIRPADTSQLTLTQLEKDEVEAFLDSRRVVSIKPVLRDPLYLFLYFDTNLYY